jgi:tRNA-uridine 2-sulfurtransferase
MSREKVLMAMSGGIDSTVAAILLKEEGHEIEGVTFRSWDNISQACMEKETGCCSIDSIFEAKAIAGKLGFNHQVIDIRQLFNDKVIRNFISEYLNGRTPNPCVVCNSFIKWGELINKADELGCEFIATGHYAKVKEENGRYFIEKGKDTTKDQSYFLWTLTQENLKRTLFPLADFTKMEVRKFAFDRGYEKLSKKRESQEICFIPDNNYRRFLKENIQDFEQKYKPGNFISTSGKILGQHKGYPNYTIGQRKGLQIALGEPMYVTKIDPKNNTVTLGNKEELCSTSFWVSDYNLMRFATLEKPLEAIVRIRYRSQGGLATIEQINNKLKITFHHPVDSITLGQSAVFYQENYLIGGGIIDELIG